MMKTAYLAYVIWSSTVGAVMLGAAWFGSGWDDHEKVTGVPKDVRDNPGVYRSHYAGGK